MALQVPQELPGFRDKCDAPGERELDFVGRRQAEDKQHGQACGRRLRRVRKVMPWQLEAEVGKDGIQIVL